MIFKIIIYFFKLSNTRSILSNAESFVLIDSSIVEKVSTVLAELTRLLKLEEIFLADGSLFIWADFNLFINKASGLAEFGLDEFGLAELTRDELIRAELIRDELSLAEFKREKDFSGILNSCAGVSNFISSSIYTKKL